ncbi:MAG: transcription termination/antitermination protein NusA [Oscillospiraceae bacterium]|nr:transcription termination/antitermination protein NusA [Oscillospiraceae bacterium]MBQ8732082.1 transcription termination/antitermination protein NusA [Oscillospiraceae bacterium]
MNNEFFEALALLEKERGIAADHLIEKLQAAIVSAIKKDYGDPDNIVVNIDTEKRKMEVIIKKLVVEEVEDPKNEIYLEDAKKISKRAAVGDWVNLKLNPKEFGRIAAQNAKHVFRQGMRDAERESLFREFQSKEHEILSATVTRVDPRRGGVTLQIGANEALLPKTEQVPGEELAEGDHVKVYVVDVTNSEKGPRVMLSRTHPGLVKRLFEIEVPEIHDGTVEIKSVSREAGSRTKLAVFSADKDVDPVGACIGPRGSRVSKIVEELAGEKIDVITYSEDPAEYIKAALSPAEVVEVTILDAEARSCQASVPDSQLSLAIGNKGQNVRLAARLTGWKIDIRPQSGYFGEE